MNGYRIVVLGFATLGSIFCNSGLAMGLPIVMDFDTASVPLEVVYVEDGFRATAINSGSGVNHFDIFNGSPAGGRFARLHGNANANAEEVLFDSFGSAFDLTSIHFLGISGSVWEMRSSNGAVQPLTTTGIINFSGPGWQNVTFVTMLSTLIPGVSETIDFDNVTFDNVPTIIPEPSTAVLLFTALLGLAIRQRRCA